jgi:hypothetical protein
LQSVGKRAPELPLPRPLPRPLPLPLLLLLPLHMPALQLLHHHLHASASKLCATCLAKPRSYATGASAAAVRLKVKLQPCAQPPLTLHMLKG